MAIERLDADLLPKIRKLDVYARQSALSDVIEGNWTTTFKGHGMEFSGYRSYQYGDDASLIDWKASLRSKSLLIKLKGFGIVSLVVTSQTSVCEREG